MTRTDLLSESERWDLLSKSAATFASQADRVARALATAERTADGRWVVPGGTQREADRARLSAGLVAALAESVFAE